jgi:formylglycine-generating enzyme required for sulfatase activity
MRGFAATAMALPMLVGCQLVGDFKSFDTNAVPLAACPSATAPSGKGPKMVQVQSPNGACFFIDSTEVTRAEYAEFLASSPKPAEQTAVCSWNTDFTTTACERAAADAGAPVDTSDMTLPVVCVDFCDAQAFCAWSGKTLCHGDFGGATQANADLSEWYSACSNGGADIYPYGANYDPTACNGADHAGTGCSPGGTCSLVPSGELASCSNHSGGPIDMSGNAAEIVDECQVQSGASDTCYVRGGAVNTSGDGLECGTVVQQRRDATSAFTGFRCCSAGTPG